MVSLAQNEQCRQIITIADIDEAADRQSVAVVGIDARQPEVSCRNLQSKDDGI